MQQQAVAAQVIELADGVTFVLRAVTPLRHQQLFAVALRLALYGIHQRAEKAAAVRGGDEPNGMALAGSERARRRIRRIAERLNRRFDARSGL